MLVQHRPVGLRMQRTSNTFINVAESVVAKVVVGHVYVGGRVAVRTRGRQVGRCTRMGVPGQRGRSSQRYATRLELPRLTNCLRRTRSASYYHR